MHWLVRMCECYDISPEVVHFARHYLEHVMSLQHVELERLQLMGSAAFLVACKCHDREHLSIAEMVYQADGAYTQQQLCEAELALLSAIEFRALSASVTCNAYAALTHYNERAASPPVICALSMHFCERALVHAPYGYQRWSPKHVALACLALARKMAGFTPSMPEALRRTHEYCAKRDFPLTSQCVDMVIVAVYSPSPLPHAPA